LFLEELLLLMEKGFEEEYDIMTDFFLRKNTKKATK